MININYKIPTDIRTFRDLTYGEVDQIPLQITVEPMEVELQSIDMHGNVYGETQYFNPRPIGEDNDRAMMSLLVKMFQLLKIDPQQFVIELITFCQPWQNDNKKLVELIKILEKLAFERS